MIATSFHVRTAASLALVALATLLPAPSAPAGPISDMIGPPPEPASDAGPQGVQGVRRPDRRLQPLQPLGPVQEAVLDDRGPASPPISSRGRPDLLEGRLGLDPDLAMTGPGEVGRCR